MAKIGKYRTTRMSPLSMQGQMCKLTFEDMPGHQINLINFYY